MTRKRICRACQFLSVVSTSPWPEPLAFQVPSVAKNLDKSQIQPIKSGNSLLHKAVRRRLLAMKRQVVQWLATGFQLGRMPKAPGTFGSLLGLPVAFGFTFLGPYYYMAGALVLAAVAIVVAQLYLHFEGGSDPQEIVIDEVAGLVIALTWVPVHLVTWSVAFVVFRILDATKPGPIGVVDRKIKGGVGVVADDLVAGLFTNLLLQILFTLSPDWWGLISIGGSFGN